MELSNENIDRLIVRYLSGNLELQDKRVLETWISKNQDNYDYFLKMKNLWDRSDISAPKHKSLQITGRDPLVPDYKLPQTQSVAPPEIKTIYQIDKTLPQPQKKQLALRSIEVADINAKKPFKPHT